jgi:hypothetical protein
MEVPTSVFPTSVLQGSILVVEDDPIQIELYAAALPRYCIIPATTVAEALSVLRRQPPVVVLLDHQLAGGERGADHVTRFKQAAPQVPVIIVSGTLGIRDQLRVMQGGLSADFVLEKPVDIEVLASVVERARTECGLPAAIQLLQSVEAASTHSAREPSSRYIARLKRVQRVQARLRGITDRPNVSSLAREFGVSRRKIIRDIRDLIHLGQFDPRLYPDWDRPWINSRT